MLTKVVAWYARRIVNVNINIILAGVLALLPVLAVVRITEWLFVSGRVHSAKLHAKHQLVITGVTFVSDIIFDVGIYFVLHWLANHTPHLAALRKRQIEGVADAAAESVPFFKDAAKVQIQRALLSPLLYFLWLGTQFLLMSVFDTSAVWATVIGFCIAIGVVRSIHTVWMLREERRRIAIATGLRCAGCGKDLSELALDVRTCPQCGAARGRADAISCDQNPMCDPSANGQAKKPAPAEVSKP